MIPQGKDIKVLIIAAIILVPIIFFPASSDLSVFMLGGKILAEGGELYKDFFDLKAPLTYYFFALLDMITGGNIIATRVVDYIITLSFVISANYILFKLNIERAIRWIFVIGFSASYVTLNNSNTMQCETLTFLPIILYFYQVVKPTKSSTILKGIFLGIIVSFKYSLGIIFIADIIYNLVYSRFGWKELRSKLIEISIVVLFVILSFLPTIWQGNTEYLDGLFAYLDKYKSHPPINLGFIKDYIKGLGYLFGDSYSLLFSAAAIFSIATIDNKDSNTQKVFNYILLFFILLFVSFLIERKTNLYQFSRVYPFLVLLTANGIRNLFNIIRSKNKIALVFLLFFALFLSPLPRLINTLKIPIDYIFNNDNYIYNFSYGGGTSNYNSMYKLREYTQNKGKNFIYVNSGSHQYLRLVDSYYKFPLSAFYLGDYENSRIRIEVLHDMRNKDYLIVQNDDNHYENFFNELSSYDNMMRIDEFRNLITKDFELDTLLDGRYYIYNRK